MLKDVTLPAVTENAKSRNVDSPEVEERGKEDRRGKSPLTKNLPTDRIAFDKQVSILRAFAAAYSANGGKPVTTDEAGDVLTPKFSGLTVTQVIAFFTDVGLLARSDKGGYIPSAEVLEFNKACQWDESEAKAKLRPIFEGTWFYRSLAPRLELAPQSKTNCLAILAGESKAEPEHKVRLQNLINFLEYAGTVSLIGETVSLLRPGRIPPQPPQAPQIKPQEKNGDATKNKPPSPSIDLDEHVLYLDAKRDRQITIQAPLTITRAEYNRLIKWIEVTLIVEDSQNDTRQ
jgi:hypothetical protein